jgi:hypothetical protein
MSAPTTDITVDELRISAGSIPTIQCSPRPETGRRLLPLACGLWIGVVAIATTTWNNAADWQMWYAAYTLILIAAVAVTAAIALSVARNGLRGPVAWVGVAATVIAVGTATVAWALPFWMGSIALGYAVLAIGVSKHRRGLAALAVAQLAGVLAVLVGEAVGIGTPDEWGDHPIAQLIGMMTVAVLTIGSLVVLLSDARRSSSA